MKHDICENCGRRGLGEWEPAGPEGAFYRRCIRCETLEIKGDTIEQKRAAAIVGALDDGLWLTAPQVAKRMGETRHMPQVAQVIEELASCGHLLAKKRTNRGLSYWEFAHPKNVRRPGL